MTAVQGAYCGTEDLRKGDIPLPSYMGDGSSYITQAAEQIDATIGMTYVTPVEFDVEAHPEHRPAFLMLKNINMLIASGRLILDLAIAGESDNMHAYGLGMLKEGLALLEKLGGGEIVLVGAEPIPVPEGEQGSFTGPMILNEDAESLVEGFYKRTAPGYPYGVLVPSYPIVRAPVQPYSGNQ